MFYIYLPNVDIVATEGGGGGCLLVSLIFNIYKFTSIYFLAGVGSGTNKMNDSQQSAAYANYYQSAGYTYHDEDYARAEAYRRKIYEEQQHFYNEKR